MAEDTLLYRNMTQNEKWSNPISGTGRVGFGNLVKDYAALNRKNMRHTDNKGYPLCYVVEVEAIGDPGQALEVEIFTAPETWVLKNAVRKWHMARNQMLERVGALGTVGEYAKTIRPYLTVAHATHGDIRPALGRANHTSTLANAGTSTQTESSQAAVSERTMSGGEWTYTQIAATADSEAEQAARTDQYHLVLTGDHDSDDGNDGTSEGAPLGTRVFTHVSMMRSYLESRRNASSIIQTADGGGTIQDEPNPLVNLMSDSISVGEVKEIVQDLQREKPPYESFSTSANNALSGNDALDLVTSCFLSTSTSYLKDKEVIRIPMGLFHARTTASAAISDSNAIVPGLRFRLLGIDKCQG
jgi:hypothetical protein